MQTMKCDELPAVETESKADSNILHLPMGLLGLEEFKQFVLLGRPEDAPFLWMQVQGDPSLAFLVVSPFEVLPDYRPDVPGEDAASLKLTDPRDALFLSIVTLHAKKQATVNLKGPIVINARTRVGKQVIIANAAEYSVQHPLPVAT